MAIADDINFSIDNVIGQFSAAMQTRGNSAWRKMALNIRAMDTVKSTTQAGNFDKADANRLVNSEFNTDTIQDVGLELLLTIQAPQFTQSLNRMKNALEPIRQMTEDFYVNRFNREIPYEVTRLSKGLVTTTMNDIMTEIGDAGFDADVVQPAVAAIAGHVRKGSNKEAVITDMQHRIKNRLETFTQIKAATIMQQFGRRMNDLFGQIQGRKAKYAGPDDEVTRDFCSEKVGKMFTAEQIKSWPANQSPWDGMIPNTDRGSIFVNLGGYNCRHILEWEE
jgi:two-component sensor histidine kinase